MTGAGTSGQRPPYDSSGMPGQRHAAGMNEEEQMQEAIRASLRQGQLVITIINNRNNNKVIYHAQKHLLKSLEQEEKLLKIVVIMVATSTLDVVGFLQNSVKGFYFTLLKLF